VTREGLALLINAQCDLQVCGEADTVDTAIEGISRTRPDVAVVDILLQGASGLELLLALKALPFPPPPVLVLSIFNETVYAERALRAGARGYLMKQAPTRMVMEGIRRVLRGEIAVSEAISSQIVHSFARGVVPSEHTEVEGLTHRELEVFQMLGQGLGTRQIARQLRVSLSTVETHRAHIKEKLRLPTGPELVRRAVEWVNRRAIM
jgi:DNA-binding NarL/FixJ family response regulator